MDDWKNVPEIDLPDELVEAARQEIWVAVWSGDHASAIQAYASLVRSISHPIAGARVRFCRGAGRIITALNLVIFAGRSCVFLYGLFTVAGFIYSWWLLLGVPATWLFVRMPLSAIQTRLNVALGARMTVFDMLMEQDAAFRARFSALTESCPKD